MLRNPRTHRDEEPRLSILLGTYNGERFLAEQLETINGQTYKNWFLYASDDGSTDNTLAILRRFQSKHEKGRVKILSGPRRGFAANFIHLTRHSDVVGDLFAYSDQDDLWLPDKLERAVKWLSGLPKDQPALLCGRTCLIDERGRDLGFSPLFRKPPSFANALVQSIAGGNTMVFNKTTRQLLCQSANDLPIVTHDWWTYLVVTGCGGQVKYDPCPAIQYRQHGNNLVGMNTGLKAKIRRIKMLYDGRYQKWNSSNLKALESIKPLITDANISTMDRFTRARSSWIFPRLVGLHRAGVYRQTTFGNLSLLAAAILGKV